MRVPGTVVQDEAGGMVVVVVGAPRGNGGISRSSRNLLRETEITAIRRVEPGTHSSREPRPLDFLRVPGHAQPGRVSTPLPALCDVGNASRSEQWLPR